MKAAVGETGVSLSFIFRYFQIEFFPLFKPLKKITKNIFLP